MGRPLNKRLFGSRSDQIQVHFHDGSSIVKGFIDHQIGTNWFVVNDGTGTLYTCQMSGTAANALSVGEMAIVAKYDSGSTTHCLKVTSHLTTTADNIVLPWTFDADPTDNYIQLEDNSQNF